MDRKKFQDEVFAYIININDKKYKLLRHHNADGSLNIELLNFALKMLNDIPIIEEDTEKKRNEIYCHLMQDKAEYIFKSKGAFDRYEQKKHYHSFRSLLNGQQEVPPVKTDGSGEARYIYNDLSKILFYNIEFRNLSADESGAHFHVGMHGETGPINISLKIGNPKIGFVALSEKQEKALFVGQVFVNIHTPNFPEGEIRGQLIPHSEIDNKIIAVNKTTKENEKTEETKEPEKTKETRHINKKKKEKDYNKSEEIIATSVWTADFVNDLPDSSFAVVEKGGKKDDEQKTIPRNYRHLPFKDESGKVDLSHLRNALDRMNQIKSLSPEDITERIRGIARKVLVTNAKKHFPDSKFAKENLENDSEKLEILKEIDNILCKNIFNKVIENFENINKLEAKLIEVKEEGAIKFFTIKVGNPEMPFMMFFDVHYDSEGNPRHVRMLEHEFPTELIPDIMKFLKTLVIENTNN